jgi:hypothetical protein
VLLFDLAFKQTGTFELQPPPRPATAEIAETPTPLATIIGMTLVANVQRSD